MSLRVDIASGRTRLHAVDGRLPGYIPLHLTRTYRSDDEEDGPFGAGWTFNLDVSLTLTSEYLAFHGPSGAETYFKPIEAGVQVRHPETGLILQHHPDSYVVVVSPRRQFVFPKARAQRGRLPLGRIEDAIGNHIQFAYQGGRLAALADTVGRRIQFDYAGPRIAGIRVSGASGQEQRRVRTFRYDRHGNLVAEQDAAGRETRYEYRRHLMVARSNRLGGTQYAQYDDEGRCLTLWHSDGACLRTLSYDPARQTTRVIDTLGRQTLYRTLEETLVLKRIGPLAEEQYYHYDEAYRLIGYTGNVGDLITTQHLEEQVLTQVDGERRLAVIHYGDMGLAQAVVDPFDNEYRLGYNDAYQLNRVTTPQGNTWIFEYDRRGWLSMVRSPEGRWVERTLSAEGITVQDEEGPRYRAQVDLFGREVERTDALGRRIQRTYDPEGRLAKVAIGNTYSVQFTYTAEGQLTGMVDSEGRKTQRRYDAFGRLQQYVGPAQERWTFQYDREGRLTAAANVQRGSLAFAYDDTGRLSQFTPFDGGARTYEVDDESIVERGPEGVVRRTYLPLGELAEVGSGSSDEQAITYGPYGELRLLDTPAASLFFDYDEEGRLTAIDREEQSLVLSRDRDGNLTGIDVDGGSRIDLHRDGRGRLVTVREEGEEAVALSYDGADRLTTLTGPEGARVELHYDPLDRLRELVVHRPGQSAQRHTFDPDDPPRSLALGGDGRAGASMAEVAGIMLIHAPHRLALTLKVGKLHLPLWLQTDLLHRDHAPLDNHILYACVEGVDALMAQGRQVHDMDLLRRWGSEAAVETSLAAIPGPHILRGMSLLRAFFLHPPFLDRPSARHLGENGESAAFDGPPAFDPVLTGTHQEGVLNPPVWSERSLATQLHRSTVLFGRSGITPDDILGHFARFETDAFI
jgi:YD repeat-containing protein